MSLVAKFSYNEGKCVYPGIRVVIGFLPEAGTTLLAINESGFVGFIPSWGNEKLGQLKTGIQLRSDDGSSIAWSKTLKQYVVVGGNNYIAQSSDSLTWEYIKNPSLKALNKVIWNQKLGHYMAIGKLGAVLISRDGKKWQVSETKKETNLNDILWCPVKQQYVLIGDTGYIALSSNGNNWKIQSSPVRSNLIGIASTSSRDNKLNYVIITKLDEAIESKNGEHWRLTLKNPPVAKGMRAIFYNHTYGKRKTEEQGIYRFFSIMSSSPNRGNKGFYRSYRYYTNGIKGNSRYTYTTAEGTWYWNSNYLRDYKQSSQIFEIKRVVWFDEIKLYVTVAANPPLFFQNGYSDMTWIWDRVNIKADLEEFVRKGFNDITLALIQEFKDDEKTVYYNLAKYS